jgi:hypothetical protein
MIRQCPVNPPARIVLPSRRYRGNTERGQSMSHLHETCASTPPRYTVLSSVIARGERVNRSTRFLQPKGQPVLPGLSAPDVLRGLCIVIRRVSCPNIFGAMLERADAQARVAGAALLPSVTAGVNACRGHPPPHAASAGRYRASTSTLYAFLLTSKDRVHVFT